MVQGKHAQLHQILLRNAGKIPKDPQQSQAQMFRSTHFSTQSVRLDGKLVAVLIGIDMAEQR